MDPQENKEPRLTNARLIGQVKPEHYADIPYVSKEVLPDFLERGFEAVEYSYPFFIGITNPVVITHKHTLFEAIDDSMKPTINQGAKVLGCYVSEKELDSIGEGVYILVFNDRMLMRRVKENTLGSKGLLLLYTDDEEATPTVAFKGDISAMWQVQRSLEHVE